MAEDLPGASSALESIYADAVGRVFVTGAVVRLELMNLIPAAAEGNQMRAVSSQQLILPMDGFVRSFEAMEQVMARLVENGIVQRRETPQVTTPVAGAVPGAPASVAPIPAAPSSSNFPDSGPMRRQ